MNDTITYTDADEVHGIERTPSAPRNPYPSGYGARIPTRYKIQYRTLHWRRVYVMNYGNSGSAYILVKGKLLFLDGATERRLSTSDNTKGK